ncbi:MAG: hypothetical protein MJZ65_02720 [Paludibacteraceae bacterium]|nr:hypothetical protein [Paludibacteraceae bacterium]
MSKIEDLLQAQNDKIDYDALIQNYPWIVEYDRKCVLSPDSDGLLCGLFMAAVRNWKIVGFYDDKVGLINNNYRTDDLVFLDGEIFRPNAKSMGHHMVCLNNKLRHLLDNGFQNCIQPNLLRNYDGKKHFRLKYPLASIHMIVSILAYADKNTDHPITLTTNATAPLFFTDGVFNVLFKYPENVLNWFQYLRINEDWNPLKVVFENQNSVFNTMQLMHTFFQERDKLTFGKERGDRLKISEKTGEPCNIEGSTINEEAVQRIKAFCTMMGNDTGWAFDDADWECWENLKFYKFSKSSFSNDGKTLTIAHFEDFIVNKNPLSWAQTSGQNIEYTKEEPSRFEFLSAKKSKKYSKRR